MRNRLVTAVALSVFLLLTLQAGCGVPSDRDAALLRLEDSLRQRLDALREKSGFPGATFAVALPDGSLATITVGAAGPGSDSPMPPDARMFSGSAGKTFVSAVALQMVDEGLFGLDDMVSAHLGDEEWYGELPNGEELTVRMLLSHTGGLPRYVFKEEFWAALNESPDRVWDPEELVAYILGEEPVHPAGKGWHYSDTDYLLIGMIIERVSGSTYHDELDRRILRPLHLDDTAPPPGRVIDGLVAGVTGVEPQFHLNGTVMVGGEYIFDPRWEWTGGGLVTTTADLARWGRNLYGGDVLSERMRRELLAFVDTETGMPAATGYGLGVQAWDSERGIIYGHGGIFPGYQTQFEYFPSLDCAVALQINADSFSGCLDRELHEYISELVPLVDEFIRE